LPASGPMTVDLEGVPTRRRHGCCSCVRRSLWYCCCRGCGCCHRATEWWRGRDLSSLAHNCPPESFAPFAQSGAFVFSDWPPCLVAISYATMKIVDIWCATTTATGELSGVVGSEWGEGGCTTPEFSGMALDVIHSVAVVSSMVRWHVVEQRGT
jgi:hypothetical protein